MKRIIIISALALLAVSCHKVPYPQDRDGEYLVYTAPGKDVDFTKFKTFSIADSLLVIGRSDKAEYSKSENALALVRRYRSNMESLGYTYTPDAKSADLGIQVTYIIKTERYVQYYDHPYWWLDYPGYWHPGYWGDWYGYYYPRPVTYVQSTNALVAEMVELTAEKGTDKPLVIVWSSYLGGYAGASASRDLARMMESIDQAFVQSPYLVHPEGK